MTDLGKTTTEFLIFCHYKFFTKKYASVVSNTLKVSKLPSFHHRLSPELLSAFNNGILKAISETGMFLQDRLVIR